MTENGHFSGGNYKVENDPWVPLVRETETSQLSSDTDRPSACLGTRLSTPLNPLYQIIDSEKYIQSLENKLAKLTKNKIKQKEPTSRDIINSLATFHEDQMRRYIDDTAGYCPSSNAGTIEESSMQASYLHRKIYPERQPLNAEEIAELLKEDVMAEKFEELNVGDDNSHTDSQRTDTIPGALRVQSAPAHSSTVAKSNQENDSALSEQPAEIVPHNDDNNDPVSSENWANFDHMSGGNERDS
ncbi:hypothetical protein EGW08_007466 [Elysia chlorotica]|uniref:Uncharacterized protein n=1 Tax=Elysia chlorotica TaxID=188477 RepID=A0A3S1BN99_ELYCH|nr:hypothetical protein EGW08_007466 [Elysia chlorotica]